MSSPFIAVLQEIIAILVSGITGLAQGIGSGLGQLVQSIFITVDGTSGAMSLSIYGGVIIVFAGIGLAIGLCKWIVGWLQTLGASHNPN